MKKFLALVIFAFAVFTVSANSRLLAHDGARQALYAALDKAIPALQDAPFGKAPIAILPTQKEYYLLSGRLKSMLNKAGFTCIDGKDDPMLDEILKEIEWSERKSDIIDPSTAVKFGKLKAANTLLLCTVRVLDGNRERIYAEIELKATEIATGKVLWADTFTATHYNVPGVMGLVKLSKEEYNVIEKGFENARRSMLTPECAAKLAGVKTISVIPLSGDVGSYMTGLTMKLLTKTEYVPKSPRIASMSYLRSAAREKIFESDAVLYGSVRALYKTKPTTEKSGKKVITKYDIVADIHLFIEDIKNTNVLWVEVIRVNSTISSSRDFTAQELKTYRQEKVDSISGEITEDVADNWKKYLKTAAIAAGAVILLIIVFVGIKCLLSYNDVR